MLGELFEPLFPHLQNGRVRVSLIQLWDLELLEPFPQQISLGMSWGGYCGLRCDGEHRTPWRPQSTDSGEASHHFPHDQTGDREKEEEKEEEEEEEKERGGERKREGQERG